MTLMNANVNISKIGNKDTNLMLIDKKYKVGLNWKYIYYNFICHVLHIPDFKRK